MGRVFKRGWTAGSSSVTAGSTQSTADEGAFYVGLPALSADEFAARLLALFPRGWLSDSAQAPGGSAYATFKGIGTPLSDILAQGRFIASGIRIKLATGTALDTIAVDFFGPNGLPRNGGETDYSYRSRILKALLLPRVTRSAIQNAVKLLTGTAPRMAEPWAPGDCAAYDVNSYYDIDGPENVAPARYGGAGLVFTGFMDVASPVSSLTGGYPIYAIDKGLAYDVGLSAYDLASISGSLIPSTNFEADILARIQAFKAMGITVGVRFTANAALSNIMYGFVSCASGATTISQEISGVAFKLQSWLQGFGVWMEVLPWQASCYLSTRGINFTVTASAAPTSAQTVAWLAATFLNPDPVALRIPVKNTQNALTCVLGIPSGTIPVLMPHWDTIPYVTGMSAASLDIGLSNAGAGNLDLVFMDGTSAAVPGSSTTFDVVADLPSSYALFATPSWATTVSVAKSSGSFTLSFGTAAPAGGGTVYWASVAN